MNAKNWYNDKTNILSNKREVAGYNQMTSQHFK